MIDWISNHSTVTACHLRPPLLLHRLTTVTTTMSSSALSNGVLSTERIQIINDQKNFTFVSTFRCLRVEAHSTSAAQNSATRFNAGDSEMSASHMIWSQSLVLSLLAKVRSPSTVQLLSKRRYTTGTLLNRLFGTNFDVMDESRRQQTTKGECSTTRRWNL